MHAAGAVAEVAAETPWNALFKQRLAQPLGLAHTYYALTSPDNPRIAGGVRSTAEEFGRFMEMLRNGGMHGATQVLSPASVAEIFTRQTPIDIPVVNSPLGHADYGVGVWLDRRDAQGELTDALAAGARGFSSWIDFDDGMVGTFATDLTLSQNIREAVDLIRAVAEQAVRNPVRCGDADLNGTVDQVDLAIVMANFGLSERLWTEGDFTGDGLVDELDLTRLQACLEIPADFDSDGDVDLADLALFEACATGPAVPYNPAGLPEPEPGCTLTPDGSGRIAADFDQDNDVDQADFGVFQRCFNGPNQPPACGT
jgi:hypothetical protein